jgi:hypothetical protein
MVKNKNKNMIWAVVIIIVLGIFAYNMGFFKTNFLGATIDLGSGYNIIRDLPTSIAPGESATITYTGTFPANTTDKIFIFDTINSECKFNSTQASVSNYVLTTSNPIHTDKILTSSNGCMVRSFYQVASSTVTQMNTPVQFQQDIGFTIVAPVTHICDDNAVQNCTTSDGKLGNQTCTSNAWGTCNAFNCDIVCTKWSDWTDNTRTRTCQGNQSCSLKDTRTATCSWYQSVDSSDKTKCGTNYWVVFGLLALAGVIIYFLAKNKKVRRWFK